MPSAGLAIRIKIWTLSFISVLRLTAIASMLLAAYFPAGAVPGPVRVSQTGRYFVDANDEPFYFLADTQWELFRRYSLGEARLILENRKAKGFTVVMVMLTGVGDGTGPNLDGHHPWLNDDPATPNPAYFTNVDAVVELALANDIQLLIGIYHQTYGNRMTVDNARSWAVWVTSRYRDYPNILWTLYPKATDRYKPIISKLAEGIQEGDRGRHLVSMHPDPSPASSSFMHAEPWLGFNSIQVWNQLRSIYPMTLADYGQSPTKPVTMLEGVYEGGEEYGYPITPLLVRREAYYTCLAGGFHGYGHNDTWRVKARWREALDDSGAKQMRILKNIFIGLADWWTLVPDQSVLSAGGNTKGDLLNLSARSTAGKWIIAYVAGQPDITVNLSRITSADSASAKWINPATGSQEVVGTYSVSGPQSFRRPADWQDAVLVVTAEISDKRPPPPDKKLGSGENKLNNLVSELLEVSSTSKSTKPFTFARSNDGWVFFSSTCKGTGTVRLILDNAPDAMIVQDGAGGREAMRYVTKGEHAIKVVSKGDISLDKLVVKAIPTLIHCGLGFNPEIKSYGLYDMDFLKRDVLPNVTTLIVPGNIELSRSVIEDWHRQGKWFVAEAGINAQAKTPEDHFKYWTGFYERASFLDGIIINEFIVNRPVAEWVATMTGERRARMEQERRQYEVYGEAIKQMRADARYMNKTLYAYVGGSGKKLNQEIIGTNFIRTIVDCGYRVALERYLHEMSSEQGSKAALQTFVNGIADWEAKEPDVKRQMVIAFGLFSMPPGGINKQPDVDYHVWMDQQMNLVANHPALSGIGGLEWWTSLLADEETVRFVGKLYRHYAIEGHTGMLTRDPLFLTHVLNADFEKGTEDWALHSAEEGSIAAKSFPRYGRIEGRYMGLGRPADPEHIGDTFLWMKRSAKGPNTFSQIVKDLEPGRLYSMKMFTCDYDDLVNPKAKKFEEGSRFIGSVILDRVDVDAKRSFNEMYSSNPEPKIPVWITYHWKVFRAKDTTAKLIVSDWPSADKPGDAFGQEQTFNFVEIQPYHEE